MLFNTVILTLLIIGSIFAAEDKRLKLLALGVVDQCEGRDSNNYTFVQEYTENLLCNDVDYLNTGDDYLIVNKKNGPNILNSLDILAAGVWPAGAHANFDVLYLGTSGNLEGKFVYIRQKYLEDIYLKICSGVLAQSLAPIKPLEVLVTEKLDPSVLISPIGAYTPFKKTATTICQGMGYNMQS